MTSVGVDQRVLNAVLWDPDGPGPQALTPVICGDFQNTGSQPLNYIGMWNGSAWVNIGAGFNMWVNAVHVTQSNQLVAGGWFTSSGATPLNRVARFDGTNWQPMSTGTNNVVFALTSTAQGGVYAGGWFTQAGNAFNSRVARFDGNQWHVPGGQPSNNWVWSLTSKPNGLVYAGGAFAFMGSTPARMIAQFNGVSWSPVGSGVNTGGEVYEVFLMPNDDLIISGNFSMIGGVPVNNVARWDGSQWHAMGNGFLSPARDFAVVNGELYAVNARLTPTGSSQTLLKWTGSTWVEIATANSTIFELLTLPNNDLLVAGNFTQIGGQPFTRIAIFRPGCACDSIDFNNDGFFPDTSDIDDFFSVFSGGPCSTNPNPGCNDIDFNNDGLYPDAADIDSLLSVFGGGPCV